MGLGGLPPGGAHSNPAPTLASTRDAHRAPTIRCIKTSGIFFIHRARHDALARPSKTPSSRPAEQSARVAFSDYVRVPSRARVHVLVAVRAPDHHGLGVGDLAGGDGDGLRDLRGGLGDGRHDLEIRVRLCRSAAAARAPGGCEGVRIRIRDVLYMGSSLYYKLCKLYVRK